MKGFPEEFDSIFRYIEVVSQRAAQLIQGAHPRLETNRSKPTLQGRDEVDEGLVAWRILTQEELEARRQALVEQFQAEMTPEGEAEVETTPTDVLPTSTESAPVVESAIEDGEDRDEDLMRLQRMIGLGNKEATLVEAETEVDDMPDPDSEEHEED